MEHRRHGAQHEPTSTFNVSLGNGCFLYTAPPPLNFFAGTSPIGTASIPVPVPAVPQLVGAELWWQWAVVDPNGAYVNLASLSDGLYTVIGS